VSGSLHLRRQSAWWLVMWARCCVLQAVHFITWRSVRTNWCRKGERHWLSSFTCVPVDFFVLTCKGSLYHLNHSSGISSWSTVFHFKLGA
jgi:hypothetical protein